MKKILSLILVLAMVGALVIGVSATQQLVEFTDGSRMVAGGTVSVDKNKTMDNIMNNCTADEYNAMIEGNVSYVWFRNDSTYKRGESIQLTDADKACQFVCRLYLFEDAECTVQCGVYISAPFTVPNTSNPALTLDITTDSLPDGIVGEEYYHRLECNDPDATFSLFRSSLPAGLDLTQHGEIEGTPTVAGEYYIVIMAVGADGQEDTAEFELTIHDGPQYSMEIWEVPNKLVYTVGETLDMTGLRVRIYGPDGYMDSADGKNLTYSTKPLTTVGEQKIKLTYKDCFEFFIVTVKPAATETDETEPATEDATQTEGEETEPEATEETHIAVGSTAPVVTENTEYSQTEPEITQAEPDEIDYNNAGQSLLIWILIIVGALLISIAAAVVIVIVIIKKKKNK